MGNNWDKKLLFGENLGFYWEYAIECLPNIVNYGGTFPQVIPRIVNNMDKFPKLFPALGMI